MHKQRTLGLYVPMHAHAPKTKLSQLIRYVRNQRCGSEVFNNSASKAANIRGHLERPTCSSCVMGPDRPQVKLDVMPHACFAYP